MAKDNISRLFEKKTKIKKSIKDLMISEIEYQGKIQESRQLHSLHLAIVYEFIKLLENRINSVLFNELNDTLIDSSELINERYLRLDDLKYSKNPSRQITASWEDQKWPQKQEEDIVKKDIERKYIPRTKGLAPMILRVATLREIKVSQSKFSFDLGEWGKKEVFRRSLAERKINLKLDELPLLGSIV
jgi:hypothetical protein